MLLNCWQSWWWSSGGDGETEEKAVSEWGEAKTQPEATSALRCWASKVGPGLLGPASLMKGISRWNWDILHHGSFALLWCLYFLLILMWEPMPLMKFEVLRPEPGYCWITGNYWSKHSYICISYNICINKIFINIFRKQPCQYWYRYFQELPYQYQYFSKVSIYRWLSFCVFCVLVALLTENYGENFWILTLFSRRF